MNVENNSQAARDRWFEVDDGRDEIVDESGPEWNCTECGDGLVCPGAACENRECLMEGILEHGVDLSDCSADWTTEDLQNVLVELISKRERRAV